MSQETTAEIPIWQKALVLTIPGADVINVRSELEFRGADGAVLTLDVYEPAAGAGERPPALIIAAGYSDARVPRVFPCRFKEVRFIVSWARLAAASGVAAITYSNREPAGDLLALIDHIRMNGASLGVDENRIGLMAASGNVPNAVSALMRGNQNFVRCAAFLYGHMLDLDGSTAVADDAAKYGFVTPAAGRSVDDLPGHVPLFIARAGHDQFAGVNDSIDRFVVKALAANKPVTLVNHADAPHGFDLFDDTDATREVMKQMLSFIRFHLGATRAD